MGVQQRSQAIGLAGFLTIFTLGGCDAPPVASHFAPMAVPDRAPDPGVGSVSPSVKLAYHHRLAFAMPGAAIEPRFRRARDACLDDAALGCLLIASTIELRDGHLPGYPSANLSVRLPHGQIEAFTASVLAPLPGEAPGATAIRSRSTRAEDMTQAIADVDRRLAQLTSLRDRLTELASRSDAKIDDLIKVEKELADAQSQIEALTAQQLHLADQVATEALAIDFTTETSIIAASKPIVLAVRDAGDVLSRNVAEALVVLIAAGPWLVLVGLLLTLLRFTWRALRRKRLPQS